MNAFEFGYAIGSLEKRALDPMAAAAGIGAGVGAGGAVHGAMNAPAGHRFEGALRGAVKAPAQAIGGVVGAGAGAVSGVGNMGFRGINSVARGADSGVRAGTQMMDKMLGGPATGIGGKLLRAPAQALGAGIGAIGGAVRAPFSAIGGVAHDIYRGAQRGANLGGRMQESFMPAPSYQQQQPKVASFGPMPQEQSGQNKTPGFAPVQQRPFDIGNVQKQWSQYFQKYGPNGQKPGTLGAGGQSQPQQNAVAPPQAQQQQQQQPQKVGPFPTLNPYSFKNFASN